MTPLRPNTPESWHPDWDWKNTETLFHFHMTQSKDLG
jgi:hypothetical protein